MKNKTLLIYRIVTGLFSALVLMGASRYFFDHEMMTGYFTALKYPTYLIYPMGIAKILGLVAIWFINNKTIKEWAYAGFVFNFLLAISAHINVNDGGSGPSIVVAILVGVSYFYYRKLNKVTE